MSLSARTVWLLLWAGSSLALTSPALAADQNVEQARRVLFIGNSYTFYNNMPRMAAELAELNGALKPVVRAVTVGGSSLQEHWHRGEAQQSIENGRWNHVVLQEFSMQPFIDERPTRRYVAEYSELIRRDHAQPVIYLTWSRAWAPERQTQLNRFYRKLAKENGALVVPVGPAWRIAQERHPDLRLYEIDGSHPTLAGSCIAAYTFHASLWNVRAEAAHPLCGEWHGMAVEAAMEALAQERCEASGFP